MSKLFYQHRRGFFYCESHFKLHPEKKSFDESKAEKVVLLNNNLKLLDSELSNGSLECTDSKIIILIISTHFNTNMITNWYTIYEREGLGSLEYLFYCAFCCTRCK